MDIESEQLKIENSAKKSTGAIIVVEGIINGGE